MSLLNQTIKKILPPDQRAIKFVENKLEEKLKKYCAYLVSYNKKEESAKKIKELCAKYKIEAIAIGNGTGGREALAFCKSIGLENINDILRDLAQALA